MKRWSLYLIMLLALGTLAYFIVRWNSPHNFTDMWSRDNQGRNTQRDVKKMPDVEAAPKEVMGLRREHQLRPLTEQEDGTKIQDVPSGVYGFSTCSPVTLSAKRGNTFSLEIHKHHDGIVYYVGYASEEDIGKYLTRQKNFHILASPHSLEKAPSLFEIPIEFVFKCEERSIRDRHLFDLFVTSIPELHT
jgi:hypothetical protein